MRATATAVVGLVTVLAMGACAHRSDDRRAPVSHNAPPARGRILFIRGDEVYVMNADGTGQRKAHMHVPYGEALPSPDGRWIAFSRPGHLYVAHPDGSDRRQVARGDPSYDCFYPGWSPDGQRLVYQQGCEVDFTSMFVIDRDGAHRRRLARGFWTVAPSWSPDGQTILFAGIPPSGRGPWALYLTDAHGGRPRKIPGSSSQPAGQFTFSWSRDGLSVFLIPHDESLYVLNRDGGGLRKLSGRLRKVYAFAVAPDGRRLALQAGIGKGWDIFVINTDGSAVHQLTDNHAVDRNPAWSPDGKHIAFASNREGNYEIYVMNDDGSNQTNLTHSKGDDEAPAWLADH